MSLKLPKITAGDPWTLSDTTRYLSVLPNGIGNPAEGVVFVSRIWPEARANARAIAAVPAILEALMALDAHGDCDHEDCKIRLDAFAKARAALLLAGCTDTAEPGAVEEED